MTSVWCANTALGRGRAFGGLQMADEDRAVPALTPCNPLWWDTPPFPPVVRWILREESPTATDLVVAGLVVGAAIWWLSNHNL